MPLRPTPSSPGRMPGLRRVETDPCFHAVRHDDELKQILVGDKGLGPAGTFAGSHAACLSVGHAADAAAMGIEIDEMKFELRGNGSLEGFMGLGSGRPGLTDVSIKALLRSKAPVEKLKELHDHVYSRSTVRDTLRNPVKISSRIVAESRAGSPRREDGWMVRAGRTTYARASTARGRCMGPAGMRGVDPDGVSACLEVEGDA